MISLSSKPVIEKRTLELLEKSKAFKALHGRAPRLCVILIGEDPASQVYVSKKGTAAEKVEFTHETILFKKEVSVAEVRKKLDELNRDANVDGILIQRPLPSQFSELEAVYYVAPKKDVDCLHPENVGLLVSGYSRFLPCTPAGIMVLLKHYGLSVSGRIVCVIGRSAIVGKPLAALLLSENATVIQVHSKTKDPATLCKQADFVFVAAGVSNLVNQDWIKPGAVVVDVGIHRNADGKLSGDVNVASVGTLPSAMTPVPGGVGPMTIQLLLENTLTAALLSVKKS
jgi:methylenetetrahydrofolate dehydrogenase (NADP+)/methenyltetrahydrofolate cyclohydrolase